MSSIINNRHLSLKANEQDVLSPISAQVSQPWVSRKGIWLIVGAFLVGIAAGAWVMNRHQHAATIIMSVNGVPITQDGFFHRLQTIEGMPVMRKLVEEQLQVQFAQSRNLAPTPAALEAKYALASAAPGFADTLIANGMTVDDYKQQLRIQMSQAAVVSQGVRVTEYDSRQFYNRQSDPNNPTALYYQPATITLRGIAVPDQSRSQKALRELTDNVPFETVAREYQGGAASESGGLMAPIVFGRTPLHKDAQLEQQLFRLAIGQQLGPVPFDGKWWIFQCVERAPAVTTPYAQVRDDCLTGARLVKGLGQNGRHIHADFWNFQHSAKIQAFWSQYQPATQAQ